MTDANPANGGIFAPESDDDVDMAGVDPLRLRETRRRIAVVKSYIILEAPTDNDRTRHAAELRLSVNQFLALVRLWREYGRASAISCAGAAKGTPRPNGPRNLPAQSKEIAAQILATLKPATSLVDAVRVITEQCAERAVRAPSRNTVWNMMMEQRRTSGHPGREGLVVSRCHVKLPVEINGQLAFPELTLALDTLTGAVLVAAMEHDNETAPAIAAAIRRMRPDIVPIIDADVAPAIEAHTNSRLLRVKPSSARTETAKVLGRGFGTLNLLYQRGRSVKPADMLRSRKDAALTMDEARRIVAEQLTAHNASRGAQPPVLPLAD